MADPNGWDIDKLSHFSDGSYNLYENFEETVYDDGVIYSDLAFAETSVLNGMDNVEESDNNSLSHDFLSFVQDNSVLTAKKPIFTEKIATNFDIPKDIELLNREENIDEIQSKIYQILCLTKTIMLQIKSEEKSNGVGKYYDFPYLFYHPIKNHRSRSKPGNKRVAETMPSIYYVISQNNFMEAIEMCKDLTIMEPKSAEPLRTLAFLYKEIGQPENSVKCSFAAALLAKTDPVLWHDLGMKLLASGDTARGLDCLMKAFRQYPKFLPNIWDAACELYRTRDYVRAMFVLLCFAKFAITEFVNYNIDIMNILTKLILKYSDYKRIGYDIEAFLNNIYPITDYELLTLFAKQLIDEDDFEYLYRSLLKFMAIPAANDTEMSIENENAIPDGTDVTMINLCNLEEINRLLENQLETFEHIKSFPIPLISYFLITIIYCDKNRELLKPLIEYVINIPPSMGDTYIDVQLRVVKAIRENNLLNILLNTYLLMPDHRLFDDNETRLYLIEFYMNNNEWNEIIHISESCLVTSPTYYNFYLFNLYSYYSINDLDNCTKYFLLFIRMHNPQLIIEINEKFTDLLGKFMSKIKQQLCYDFPIDLQLPINCMLLYSFITFSDINELQTVFRLSSKDIFRLMKNILIYLYNSGRQEEALQFPSHINMIVKKVEGGESINREILINSRFLKISIALKLKEYATAFEALQNYTEDFVQKEHLSKNSFWNLVSLIFIQSRHEINSRRQQRFLQSLDAAPSHPGYFLMKSYMNSMTYYPTKILGDSLTAIELGSNYSLPYLIHGVQLLHLSHNSSYDNLAAFALQGLLFIFKYFHTRGGNDSQEALYNVGRAFQELNMMTYAVTFYRNALTFVNKPKHPGNSGLNREVAYNLSLIYHKNDNKELALNTLRMHCML